MGRGNWIDHPELVRLRENNRKSKVLVEKVKLEMQDQPPFDPVVHVIEDKTFKPSMTIRLRYETVVSLSEKR